MSSQGTEKNWFETTFDSAWAQAGVYTGRTARWGAVHVPGGAKVFWTIVGLILLGLLLLVIYPGQQAMRTGRGGITGPMPVGASLVSKGDIAITLNALGTVTPLATVTVRPQVS